MVSDTKARRRPSIESWCRTGKTCQCTRHQMCLVKLNISRELNVQRVTWRLRTSGDPFFIKSGKYVAASTNLVGSSLLEKPEISVYCCVRLVRRKGDRSCKEPPSSDNQKAWRLGYRHHHHHQQQRDCDEIFVLTRSFCGATIATQQIGTYCCMGQVPFASDLLGFRAGQSSLCTRLSTHSTPLCANAIRTGSPVASCKTRG